MASRASIAARAGIARGRLTVAMERLSKRHGVPLPVVPPVHYRQPELRAVADLERLADFLEEVTGGKKKPEPAPEPDREPDTDNADEGEEPTFHGYPLSEFDGKSDEQILEYDGIGAATLAKIREAQEEKE